MSSVDVATAMSEQPFELDQHQSDVFAEEQMVFTADTVDTAEQGETYDGTQQQTSDKDTESDKEPTSPVRRQGLSSRILPGDWRCDCGVNNFASRQSCVQCGANSSVPPSPRESIGSQSSNGIRRVAGDRPGDWTCLEPTCQYHNYASRGTCHRCNAPKPADLDMNYDRHSGEISAGYGSPGSYGGFLQQQQLHQQLPSPIQHNGYSPSSPTSGSPTGYNMPMYAAMQGGMQPMMYGQQARPGHVPYAPYGPRYNPQPIQMKKGDWICSCGDLNFARRDRCRMCGQPGGDGYHAMIASLNAAAAAAAAANGGSSPPSPVSPIHGMPPSPTGSHLFMMPPNLAMYNRPAGIPLQARPQAGYGMHQPIMIPVMPGAYGAFPGQQGPAPPGYYWMSMPANYQMAPQQMMATGRPVNIST